MKQSRKIVKLVIVIFSWVIFAITFVLIHPIIGLPAASFSTIPVILMAWFYGARMGLIAGLLTLPVSIMLVVLFQLSNVGLFIAKSAPGIIVATLSGMVIGHLRDIREELNHEIKERILVEKALRESEAKFRSVIEQSSDGIVLTDEQGDVIEWNRSQENITGLSRTEALGKPIWDILFQTLPEEQRSSAIHEAYKANTIEFLKSGQATWANQLTERDVQHPNKTRRIIQGVTFPIKTSSGYKSASISRDVTDRKQAEEKLIYLSTHDSLTGLYNRAYFEEELARFERSRQFPISIMMIDVNHLKQTNDSMGHSAGDSLLKGVAQVLITAFRNEDVIARIGGDEFAVILPETDKTTAENAIQRVQQFIQYYNTDHKEISVGLAIGVSTTEERNPLVNVLMDADSDMYRRKREYKIINKS